jgi:protein kinase C substrate 80K-H
LVQFTIFHLILLTITPALYVSLLEHSNALKSLQREHKQHLEREKALGEILNTLRSGYNPNYQDMAVLEAVRGWEELANLPHINDVRKDGESSDSKQDTETDSKVDKEEEDQEDQDHGIWSAEKLEKDLDELVRADYVSLLLEHEEHIRSPEGEFSICEYPIVSCQEWC